MSVFLLILIGVVVTAFAALVFAGVTILLNWLCIEAFSISVPDG
jgi:hypothetical protein